jgi:aminoglycoside/choline kinase family phosphotransferase
MLESTKLVDIPVIRAACQRTGLHPTVSFLAGDASDRKFYRLVCGDFSAICMMFPKWEGGYGGDPLSWLGMQKALQEMEIPVPAILHVDEKECCIWTEDFGDLFLNHELGKHALERSHPQFSHLLKLYQEALDLLVKAQYPEHAQPSPANMRSFDTEKLMFEMHFFAEHFLHKFLELNVESSFFENVMADLKKLCTWLHAQERVLCHRDYHVRNIMIHDGHAKWIDFQDARMGPHTYDVVSLVRDSYVKISPDVRFELFQYYFQQTNVARQKQNKQPLEWSAYSLEVERMAIQRNIKAIGSFGYLATSKQKPNYLAYVPFTVRSILEATPLDDKAAHGLEHDYPHLHSLLFSLRHGPLSERLSEKMHKRGIAPFGVNS